MLDVGCGIGDFVKWFIDHRIDAWGLEGTTNALPHLVAPKDRVYFADLRQKIVNPAVFELATCFEVAEHIDLECADQFVDNLCAFAPKLIMSIAGPGQKGHGHVNMQTKEWWADLFASHAFTRNMQAEDKLLAKLYPYTSNRWMNTIYQNLVIFERRSLP